MPVYIQTCTDVSIPKHIYIYTHIHIYMRFIIHHEREVAFVSNSLQPHGVCSPWKSPGQNTGVGSLSLLQGIFPTQGSNPGLLHYRRILYQLSHQGSPLYTIGHIIMEIRNSTVFNLQTGEPRTLVVWIAVWVQENTNVPAWKQRVNSPLFFLLFFFYSGLQGIGWGPPKLGVAICFAYSTT